MFILRYIIQIGRVWRVLGCWNTLKYYYSQVFGLKLSRIYPIGFEHSIYLRVATSDYPVFMQVFIQSSYNINLNFTPSVIIDCGANIGLTSIYLSHKYPEAKIIAVEPEESNYQMLLRNTHNYPMITCLKSGIWNKSCYLEIIDNHASNWSFMVKETDQKEGIVAISIQEIVKKYNLQSIDILKIDIEGSEKEVFGSDLEAWLPITKLLIVELHDRYKHGCSMALFKALSNYNYDLDIKGDNIFIYIHHIL
mgnify:FL=1